MLPQESLLVTLVKLVAEIPLPPAPAQRQRGGPRVYSDRLFLKALVIMIVQHLHHVHELLAVLAEPTAEMQTLRRLLLEQGRYPPPPGAPGSGACRLCPPACRLRSAAWAATWWR